MSVAEWYIYIYIYYICHIFQQFLYYFLNINTEGKVLHDINDGSSHDQMMKYHQLSWFGIFSESHNTSKSASASANSSHLNTLLLTVPLPDILQMSYILPLLTFC